MIGKQAKEVEALNKQITTLNGQIEVKNKEIETLKEENKELKKLIKSMYEHAVEQRQSINMIFEASELIEKQIDKLLMDFKHGEKKRDSNIKRGVTRKTKHFIS